ncbi:MAG: hypothetical protein ACRDRJ_48805 [Streptosporangiaceae bacterium]
MTTDGRVAPGAAASRAAADRDPADRPRHPAVPDVVATMTGFARALRTAGVSADRTRLATSIAALAEIDPLDIDEVYWATRLSLCSEPDDLPRFDAVFGQWFRGSAPALPGLALLPPAAGGRRSARSLPRAAAKARATMMCSPPPPPATWRSCAGTTSPSSASRSGRRSTG